MGLPAAKEGDRIVAVDMHLIQPPAPSPPFLVPHPFNGILDSQLSQDVKVEGKKAATLTSKATNTPSHVPIGGTFVIPPTNEGQIITGSSTVFINKKPAARASDTALTCNDPVPAPVGTVVVPQTKVFIGG